MDIYIRVIWKQYLLIQQLQYSIPQKFTTWIKSLISFKFDTDEKLFVETQ